MAATGEKIDLSLDDIIKQNKGARGGGARRGGARGGARGGGRGGVRARSTGSRSFNTQRNQSLNRRSGNGGMIRKRRSAGASGLNTSKNQGVFKAAMKVPEGKWSHDLFRGGRGGAAAGGGGSLTTSGKITISNLDFGVNDKDIKDLFEEFGAIKRAAVHYDRSGRSLGTADVVFEKRQDAVKAVKKYNGVALDGRPMNIELAGGLAAAGNGAPSGGAQRNGSTAGRIGGRGGRGGSARGGRGGQRRQGGAKPTPKTAAELDAELDSYAAKMDTN